MRAANSSSPTRTRSSSGMGLVENFTHKLFNILNIINHSNLRIVRSSGSQPAGVLPFIDNERTESSGSGFPHTPHFRRLTRPKRRVSHWCSRWSSYWVCMYIGKNKLNKLIVRLEDNDVLQGVRVENRLRPSLSRPKQITLELTKNLKSNNNSNNSQNGWTQSESRRWLVASRAVRIYTSWNGLWSTHGSVWTDMIQCEPTHDRIQRL